MKGIQSIALGLLLALSQPARAQTGPALPPEITGIAPSKTGETEGMTIDKIVNSLVLSPSNREENALFAPAWVITITREEIEQRGYLELTDLMDDLPGMEIARAHGDTYFRPYWRGYRSTIGAPYLLMVDGLVFNHLWLNEAEIMAAFPMSNIERVEISYGPASAVYGPNAAMGVINVITRTNRKEPGVEAQARLFTRAPQSAVAVADMTKVADGFVLFKNRTFRFSLSGRFDFGVLDPGLADQTEYTRNRYYTDRRLYGDFLDSPEIAGAFRSESRKQAIDARLTLFDKTEIGVQMYRMRNGGGVTYAADRAPNRIPYVQLERSIFARHNFQLWEKFASTSTLRYRESNIDSPTAWLEFEHSSQQATFQYWQAINYSWTAAQEFSLALGSLRRSGDDDLKIDFGFKYERKDLERDYIKNGASNYWDPSLPFASANGRPGYTFPQPTAQGRALHNRNQVDTVGAYMLARYQIVQDHIVNLGLRVDHNSFFGVTSPIFRGGYVGRVLNDYTVKLMYGQAVQEPTWRELFGTFSATGSNADLKRERSQTFEASVAFTIDWLAVQGNLYYVDYTDAIISVPGTSINLGRRHAVGADLSAVALIKVPGIKQLKLWAYYSPYFLVKETEFPDPNGVKALVDVGDLSAHKAMGGATVELNTQFDTTVLGRCFSDRKTVRSNPLGSVPGYCSFDLAARGHFLDEKLSLTFKVSNLLDTKYVHPGVLNADAGTVPGRWVDDKWKGSAGYFNSELPQPGRAFTLVLDVKF